MLYNCVKFNQNMVNFELCEKIVTMRCCSLDYGKNHTIHVFRDTRKAKAAYGRLSFELGYNQTCHWYHNLQADIPKLHAKFHQNPWCGFGEKW